MPHAHPPAGTHRPRTARPACLPLVASLSIPADIVTQPLTERPRVPIITVGLRPHPTSPDAEAPWQGPVGRLLATMFALPEGGAVFEFRLEESRPAQLAIPAPATPGPADELWKHTCFEVFLGVPGWVLAEQELSAIERGEAPMKGRNLALGAKWLGIITTGVTVLAIGIGVLVGIGSAKRW